MRFNAYKVLLSWLMDLVRMCSHISPHISNFWQPQIMLTAQQARLATGKGPLLTHNTSASAVGASLALPHGMLRSAGHMPLALVVQGICLGAHAGVVHARGGAHAGTHARGSCSASGQAWGAT